MFSKKTVHDSGSPSSEKAGGWGKVFRAATAIGRVAFRAPALAKRLILDDRRLVSMNRKVLQPQRQSADPRRRRITWIMLGLTILQLALLFAAFYTMTSKGPWHILVRRLNNFKVPKLAELFDLPKVIPIWSAFFLISAGANVQFFLMFRWRKSPFQKMQKALLDAQLTGKDGTDDHWYYPGRMLYLDLIGVTGDDIVKRESLWNQAGFQPTADFRRLPGENKYIFTGAPSKPSNSTMQYDRYAEWTTLMQDKLKVYHWFLGEYVNRNQYKWKDAYKDFSIAFIGQSGSGKTEAMKMWLAAFYCMHTGTRLVIADLKMTGDWDVFGPLCESGRVVKSVEETLLAICYFDDLLNARTKYMAEKGYKNIKSWGEAEGIEVPPILLIIDEFPQMNGPLKFDMQSRRDGTPANVLFKLLTKGRSFGLWVVLGSQFSGSDAIPSELNKNIKVHVTLRTGSEGESMQWINSSAAFRIGKGKTRPDGEEDAQEGYAYIDAEEEYVRFWYMDDWFIVHELLKYGAPVMEGLEHKDARVPGIPIDIDKRLKLLAEDGRTRLNLSEFDQERLRNHEKAIEEFSKSFAKLRETPNPRLLEKKQPLGLLWKEGESIEDYIARSRKGQGMATPPSLGGGFPSARPSSGGLGAGGSMSGASLAPSSGAVSQLSPAPRGFSPPGTSSVGPGGPERARPLAKPDALGKTVGKAVEKSVEKSVGKVVDKPSDRDGERTASRGLDKAIDRARDAVRVPDRPIPAEDESDVEFARALETRRLQRREAVAKNKAAEAASDAKRATSLVGGVGAKRRSAGTKPKSRKESPAAQDIQADWDDQDE